jgi:histidine triad (HIT) family protein
MICEYCEIINGKSKAVKVFEDTKVVAILNDRPASAGHILLMPKEHYPIIEQVPDFIISHLFVVANKLSVSAFEGMNATGTNIMVNNGVAAGQNSAHFMIHIIPRRENDGLNLSWQPKQLSQEEFATTELMVNEFTKTIGEFETEKPKPIVKEKEREIDEEDFIVKALDRIP